jgi:hypothetical protein
VPELTAGTIAGGGAAGLCPGELRETICDATTAVCTSCPGLRLQAIVLTGSLAREEATITTKGKITTLVGDADFLIVLEPDAVHPREAELCGLAAAAENRLSESGISVRVGLGAVSPDYFNKLSARSFTYELKNSGRVVWGNPKVLDRIPRYDAAELSHEDAWRTLNHRMIEVLMQVDGAEFAAQELPVDLEYVVTKLYLDMATSYLIFAGRYQPTYALRARELCTLAAEAGESDHPPFNLKEFSNCVSECTERKLMGVGLGVNKSFAFLREAAGYACQLWDWETGRLSGINQMVTVGSVIAAMGRRQTFAERLRGWASLARRAGWQAACRNWLRWARLSMIATPRYLIYGAAVQAFCELPRLPRNPDVSKLDTDLGGAEALLPALSHKTSRVLDWRSLISDIVWCYRTFLLDTLA